MPKNTIFKKCFFNRVFAYEITGCINFLCKFLPQLNTRSLYGFFCRGDKVYIYGEYCRVLVMCVWCGSLSPSRTINCSVKTCLLPFEFIEVHRLMMQAATSAAPPGTEQKCGGSIFFLPHFRLGCFIIS